MRKVLTSVCVISLIVLSASLSIAESATYSITDLGTTIVPVAINNTGQVVGYKEMGDGHDEAIIYQGGVVTGLGTFGGTDSIAMGMNSSGYIVGNFKTSSGETHGFQVYNNVFTDLFSAAGIINVAGVNNSNTVFGSILGPYNEEVEGWLIKHAVFYDNGLVTNISMGMNADNSHPVAINDVGQAVFAQYPCGDCKNSFLYSGGTLESFGWFIATDLNDQGHLVGTRSSYSWNQDDEGILYHDGTETILNCPGPDCYPQAINNQGQIVGNSRYDDTYHAFVYSNGSMTDLDALLPSGSGWNLVEATDINDSGQIIGFGWFNADWHAYLLDPLQEVEIRILSNSGKDKVRLYSNDLLTVAIISTPAFDANTVNPVTIKLAGAVVKTVGKGERYFTDLEDVNGDGLMDLVCKVPIGELNIEPSGTSARFDLEAQTFDGQKIQGEATVPVSVKQNK